MKRFFTTLIMLALLGGGIYAVALFLQRPGDDANEQIRTDTVQRRNIKSVVNASGEVLPLIIDECPTGAPIQVLEALQPSRGSALFLSQQGLQVIDPPAHGGCLPG